MQASSVDDAAPRPLSPPKTARYPAVSVRADLADAIAEALGQGSDGDH